MLSFISNGVANFFIKRNVVTQDDKEVIQYGVEITLSTLLGFTIVLLIGIAIDCILESIVFLMMLSFVKKNTGGYHANSYLTCNLCTVGIFLANVMVYKLATSLPAGLWFAIGIISCILIGIYAPCEHINHPLSANQKQKYKKISIGVSLLTLFLSFLLYKLNLNIYVFVLLVLTTICINLIIGIKTGGGKNEFIES